MAATNFTPIQLYHSTTASAAPTAGNLVNGELAINILDGKLYYKDNGGVVQVIATKGTGTIGGSTTQVQYNNTGALAGSANFTFDGTTATINTLNLTNALGAAYGGTAQSTYAQGDLLYASAANTLAKLPIGISTYILTSNGSIPGWSIPSSVVIGTATNLAGGAAGSVPYQSGASTTAFLSIGTVNQVITSTGSAPQWSSALTLTGLSNSGLTTLDKTVTVGNTSFNGAAVFAPATPAKVYLGTGTVTDVTSAIAATNAAGAIVALGVTPIAATNANVTYTNASTLYIAGAPSAGTNITITNPYALYVAAGDAYFGGTVTAGTVNLTTLDLTNLEVTNIKAKDGTASMTLADSTGIITLSATAGTANGVLYLNGSRAVTSDSKLTFDGTTFSVANGVTGGTSISLTGSYAGSGTVAFMNFQRLGGAVAGTLGYDDAATAIRFGTTTNHSTIFLQNNTEAMRLTSTGLGIGTSSPKIQEWRAGTYLTVANASTRGQVEIDGAVADSGSASLGALIFTYSTNTTNHKDVALIEAISSGVTANQRGGVLNFYTKANGTASPALNMTLDSSGNLGLGVTPSAWGSAFKVLQLANGTSLSNNGQTSYYQIGANNYFDGTNYRYIASNFAGFHRFSNVGAYEWHTAPSGTAGNTISFTQAMTLDASGRLLVGLTADTAAGGYFGIIQAQGSYPAIVLKGTETSAKTWQIGENAGSLAFYNTTDGERARITSGGDFRVKGAGTAGSTEAFQVSGSAPADAARLDSNGNLLVGTTTSSAKVSLQYSGASAIGQDINDADDQANSTFVQFRVQGTQAGTIKRVASTSAVVYNTTSDYRLKNVVGAVTGQGSRIDALKPIDYQWKQGNTPARGFLAHEFQEVYPSSVSGTKDAVDAEGKPVYQAMQASTSEVIADLVAELQSLRARVAQLEQGV